MLRDRISSAALWRALRCATATSVPALIGALTGNGDFGWAALGGFEAVFADLGGSYQARFTAMGLLSVGGAAGLFLGMISSGHVWSVFFCTVVWSFLWSYASVLGGTVSAFNALVIVIFLCGVETHVHSPAEAAQHALYLFGGGLWAIVLSFFLWPIHPYRPARRAVGKCYEEMASMIATTIRRLGQENAPRELWDQAAQRYQYDMRNTLENARTMIAASRAQFLSESLRGEQLLVLLETADVMLGYAIAAIEHAEQIQADPLRRKDVTAFLEKWRESLLWVEETAVRDRLPKSSARDDERARVRRMSADFGEAPADRLLTHLAQMSADAMDVAITSVYAVRTGLEPPESSAVPIGPSHGTIALPSLSMWRRLRDAWAWNSVTLRRALRVSVVCGAGILIAAALHLNHGYWIPMTSVIVLRPHLAATWIRSLERTLGSAAGGAVAAAVVYLVRSKIVLAGLLFPLSFATLASLPVSYAFFVFFLTPTFVIASLPYAGDWQLAVIRAIDTTVGAAIALPAMYGLWPMWAHEGFRERLATSFQADVDYFATLERSWRNPGSVGPIEIARARRQGGLSNNAAEEALDQLLNEPKTQASMREPALTFVTYARRLAQSVTSLHNHPPQKYDTLDVERLAEFKTRLEKILDGLRSGKFEYDSSVHVHASPGNAREQLDVLERQIGVLESAAARLFVKEERTKPA